MAKDKLTDYSATNSLNTDVGSINIDEGMLPSDVNNAIREVMTHLKDFAEGTQAINAVAVDNLKLDANTLSSTNLNGNIVIDPNGTGSVQLGGNLDLNGNDITGTGNINNTGTITTDGLTVDTNTLYVDSTNNRVGIGTASPDRSLHIAGSEPTVVLENTGQGTDLKTWRMYSNSSSLQIGTVDDAFASGQNALEIGRDNTDNITSIQFKTGASSERMRIDSSGNLLHQRTSNTISGTSVNKMTLGDGTGQYGVIVDVGSGSGYYGFAKGGTYNSRIRYDYTSDYMAFDVNGSQRMMIDSSGNVGIGTAAPATAGVGLHVQTSSTSISDTVTADVQAIFERNGNAGIAIVSGATSVGSLKFGAPGDLDGGRITYSQSVDSMQFLTADLERMRIDSSGNVGIGTSSPIAQSKLTVAGGAGSISVTGSDGNFAAGGQRSFIDFAGGKARIGGTGGGGAGTTLGLYVGTGLEAVSIAADGTVTGTDFIIPFPAGAAPSGTFTHYNNGSQQSGDNSHLNMPMACALTVKAVVLYVNSALSSGSATVQLMKNQVAQDTINVTTGTNYFANAGLSISFNQGDRMGIKIVGTSTSAAWYNVSVLCERA